MLSGRIQCTNNLKQVALATHSYHDAVQLFPPGILLSQDVTNNGKYRGASLFVFNVALADGSVCFLTETIPLITLRALSTRQGGETVINP